MQGRVAQGKQAKIVAIRKNHVLATLDLEVLFHVLTDQFDLTVNSLFKLVHD